MERGINKRGAAIKMEEWWPGKENGKQGEENSQTARPVALGGGKSHFIGRLCCEGSGR